MGRWERARWSFYAQRGTSAVELFGSIAERPDRLDADGRLAS